MFKWFFNYKAVRLPDKLVFPAFALYHFAFSVILFLIYTEFYKDRSKADIFKYYDDARYLKEIIKECPEEAFMLAVYDAFPSNCSFYYYSLKSWENESTFLWFNSHRLIVVVISLILMVADSYYIVCALFSIAGLIGQWLLYRTFSGLCPPLALLILFFPSINLWTGGILKESIAIIPEAFLLSALTEFAIARSKITIKWLLTISICIFLLLILRPFAAISMIVFLISFFLTWKKNSKKFVGLMLCGYVVVGMGISFLFFDNIREAREVFVRHSIIERSGSLYSTRIFNSYDEFLMFIPVAIFNGIFRPCELTLDNPVRLFSTIENLGFLLLITVLVLKGVYRKVLSINALIFPCVMALLCYACIIGILISVEGALARFKLFFWILAIYLVCIIEYGNKSKLA